MSKLNIGVDPNSMDADGTIVSDERSRHSSVGGPYRGGRRGLSFPTYHSVSTPGESGETYARSLGFQGNGHPPWEVEGNLGRLKSHLRNGVSIGDVGYFDEIGQFASQLNIFDESNTGIQSESLPVKFKPLSPPLAPSEVSRSQLAPGTTIVGQGIDVTRVSESPLEISFTSTAREGGILVLPDGASREDWISHDRLKDYIKEHVVDWYQFFNHYHEVYLGVPNGVLYLVTGCDKAKSWGTAVIPEVNDLAGRAVSSMTFKDGGWPLFNAARCRRGLPTPSRDHASVFIRGICVALNEKYWAQHLPTVPRHESFYYNILTTPIIGWRARLLTRKQTYLKPKSRHGLPRQPRLQFHPSSMLLQILLTLSPSAQIAMVDDSVWSSVVDGSHGSLPEIKRLTKKVFQLYRIHQENDIVTLVPKPVHLQENVPSSSGLREKLSRVVRPFLLARKKTPDEIALNKVSKFFSSLR